MKISKTQFKEFSKCKSYYAMNEVYNKKMNASQDEEEIKNILRRMYSEEGEDEVRITNEQLEAMQFYYKEVERLALKEAAKTFGKEFIYFEDNNKQMMISYFDRSGHQLYTYLDGYHEDNQEITIIEVKATTSRKFLNLGPTKDKKLVPIFSLDESIITLKEETYNDKKMMNYYMKLFDRYDDCGKYIYDIAVTNYIMDGFRFENNRLAYKKVKYYLAVLNSNYVYSGTGDYERNPESIIHFIDVSEITNEYQKNIEKEFKNIIKYINEKELHASLGECCKGCIFENTCFPVLKEKNNVRTLLSPKSVKINNTPMKWDDLINNGYLKITDIPFECLEKEKHIIQYNTIINSDEYLDVSKVKEEIKNNIKYPIYHLDFESLNLPLPRFKGEKPYTQSLFQYSIHIQKERFVCDKVKDNYNFLPYDFLDNREELVKKMIKTIDLSEGGTVLVYNENFEKSRIKELMELFPHYKQELQKIYDHIYDLMNVVKGKKSEVKYYNYKMNGSYSIKKLLPIYSDISYSELDVQNGVDAQVAYLQFKNLPKEDIIEERKKLLTYCGQDTYSMVEILDGIIKKIEL